MLDQEPQDIRSDHDYQVATQKFEDLQSHLKAKQKISQLQSSKVGIIIFLIKLQL